MGQTFSLAHLAPFVDVSRQKFKAQFLSDMKEIGITPSEDQINAFVEKQVNREIKNGVQTIQYQLITLMTTNGQTPFVTMSMNLDECNNDRERDDMAAIMKEVMIQRMKGVKNEVGQWVPIAFPKLIYFTTDDNIKPTGKYYYLTELAAKCSVKVLVPDYVSTKIMKQYKGDVYPPMGCRSFLTRDRFTDAGVGNIANAKNYVPGKHKYYGRFNQGRHYAPYLREQVVKIA